MVRRRRHEFDIITPCDMGVARSRPQQGGELMTLLLSDTYDALIGAGANQTKAKAAALDRRLPWLEVMLDINLIT